MKKIVALVLCLVLALSLCTVAFAESGEGYTLVTLTNSLITDSDKLAKADSITITKTASSTTTTDGKSTTTVYPDKYVIVYGDPAETITAYVCDDSIADYRLVKGSTVISLTKTNAVDLSKGVTDVATAKIAAKTGKLTCTDIVDANGDSVAAFAIGGKYYTIGGTKAALLNGKVVLYGTEVKAVGHKLTEAADATVTFNAKGEPVSIACGVCKANFSVVKAAGVPTTYTAKPTEYSTLGFAATTDTFYVLDAVAASSSTTVDSPKTFDAGIALYAGMALMSVAGSAVVIGKKEF